MVDEELKNALLRRLGDEAVRFDVPMAQLTTFRVGGPVDCLVEPRDEESLVFALQACRNAGIEARIVGLGSDLLVSDEGLRCVVVRIADNLSDVSVSGSTVRACAGASNAKVARAACEAGLAGYEFASGIPGTVGGAAIMNAGAYGGEFRDVARSLRCLTPDGRIVEVSAEEADWSYRHSMMDHEGYVVLSAVLELAFDDPAAIAERMEDLERRRAEKQPLELPSAGSTFKRPEGYFAGKLVQDAGLRGYRVGGAQVSTKHCGFVVNVDGASAADVRRVIADVQDRVQESAGVRLQPEVRMWGFREERR
ncbi:UDP-N-acetylmuramate dehydrogenase [Paraeggerthella hongkongensis]|uniref:UDP-N-acetylenolpyruvoylglucosamine reductase n=1 Tax=Paraeggerthella hongkongensis TaxID=230658 RepID=A0A3N0BK84_9ACTN|nr:UDP-N-acetylmuramate dehydrogenase [Paraeggerthella hongkongensis]RNL48425.1 UDP-N-acetylenolpyruvoylglucosamine reductase [Paraeggerthella hongkongensis]